MLCEWLTDFGFPLSSIFLATVSTSFLVFESFIVVRRFLVYGMVPTWTRLRSIARRHCRGSCDTPRRASSILRTFVRLGTAADGLGGSTNPTEKGAPTNPTGKEAGITSDVDALVEVHKVTLYEESSKYADMSAVAQEVIFEITSKEHFDDVVSRAAGADKAFAKGYEDAQGNWRIPHKLLMVQIHAGWCRVCKGLQPKLLKLVTRHPEVLCCKVNKTNHEDLAAKLGVRGLPMIIFYKNGLRIDHFTTANINIIEEAIVDNS